MTSPSRRQNHGPSPLKAGRIFWRRVSSIPGPHLFQFVWWYFANRFARWRDKAFHGLVPDLLYSPGINAPDADAITVHIVFQAFYEQVRRSFGCEAIRRFSGRLCFIEFFTTG